MGESAQDILNRKGGDGLNAGDFVGQTLTIADVEWDTGQFGKYAIVTAVTAEGEEVSFKTGAKSIVGKLQDLEKGGFLPIDVVVTSYPSKYGKDGYDIEAVEG